MARKHDINPEYRTATRNHIKFPKDPTALKKPLNCVNGMNTKTLKIRRLEELPSAPLSNVKRFSYAVKSSTLSNLRNKRRKVTVPEEKPVVMTKLPEIESDTEMRQVYISLFTAICLPFLPTTLFFICISSAMK